MFQSETQRVLSKDIQLLGTIRHTRRIGEFGEYSVKYDNKITTEFIELWPLNYAGISKRRPETYFDRLPAMILAELIETRSIAHTYDTYHEQI